MNRVPGANGGRSDSPVLAWPTASSTQSSDQIASRGDDEDVVSVAPMYIEPTSGIPYDRERTAFEEDLSGGSANLKRICRDQFTGDLWR